MRPGMAVFGLVDTRSRERWIPNPTVRSGRRIQRRESPRCRTSREPEPRGARGRRTAHARLTAEPQAPTHGVATLACAERSGRRPDGSARIRHHASAQIPLASSRVRCASVATGARPVPSGSGNGVGRNCGVLASRQRPSQRYRRRPDMARRVLGDNGRFLDHDVPAGVLTQLCAAKGAETRRRDPPATVIRLDQEENPLTSIPGPASATRTARVDTQQPRPRESRAPGSAQARHRQSCVRANRVVFRAGWSPR